MFSADELDAAIRRLEDQINGLRHGAAKTLRDRAGDQVQVDLWRKRQEALCAAYATSTGEVHPLANFYDADAEHWRRERETRTDYLGKLDAEIYEARSHVRAAIHQRQTANATREQQAAAHRHEAHWGRRLITLLREWKEHARDDHPDGWWCWRRSDESEGPI